MTAQHTPADIRGLPVAPAPAVNPHEEAFEDALDNLIQFVADDAIRSSTPMPNGRGCCDPDSSAQDQHCEALRRAARAAFAPQSPTSAAVIVVDGGLFTQHDPDARCITADESRL